MPRYANSTNEDITHQGVRVPAKGTTTTYRFLTSLPTGVTLVATAPSYNPILFSDSYLGDSGIATLTLDSDISNYQVSFYCYGGRVSIAFNDIGLTPVLELIDGQKVTMSVSDRNIAVFIFTYLASGSKLRVNIVSGGVSFL